MVRENYGTGSIYVVYCIQYGRHSLPIGGAALSSHQDKTMLLGVDSLDATKGLVHKFLALEEMFGMEPDLADRVNFVQVRADGVCNQVVGYMFKYQLVFYVGMYMPLPPPSPIFTTTSCTVSAGNSKVIVREARHACNRLTP